MKLAFTLSMPNVGSWNGKWSGDNHPYVRVIDFGRSKKGAIRAQEILEKESYYYNFGDGWGASVAVREVDGNESRKLKRISMGFCGYDWMIQSIRKYGRIQVGG